MKNKNDVVIIELDRPRELRFGHKALKTLLTMTGQTLEDIESGQLNLEEIEKYLYCGLISDARKNGESLKLEDMEDLLDQAPSFQHNIDKLTEAFGAAFGTIAEGNLQQPVENQPAQR